MHTRMHEKTLHLHVATNWHIHRERLYEQDLLRNTRTKPMFNFQYKTLRFKYVHWHLYLLK